jgi:hypothetical protein
MDAIDRRAEEKTTMATIQSDGSRCARSSSNQAPRAAAAQLQASISSGAKSSDFLAININEEQPRVKAKFALGKMDFTLRAGAR